jgi:hypothetical protein
MRGPITVPLTTAAALSVLLVLDAATAAGPGSTRTHLSQAAPATEKAPENAPDKTQTPAAPAAPAVPVTPAPPPPNNPAAGTPAAILDDQEVDSILGKNVRSSAGENMGRIIDVLVSRDGKVRGAVIDFGGFLGVGSRKIAIDWSALRFVLPDKSGQIAVDLTKDQLRVAPEYKPGAPVVILGATGPADAPGSPPSAPAK